MEKSNNFYCLAILAVANLILICVYLGYSGYALYLVDKHSKFNKGDNIYRSPYQDDDIDFRFNDGEPTFYGVMLIIGLIVRLFMLMILQINNYYILIRNMRHDIPQQLCWNVYVLSGVIPDTIMNIIIASKINENESAPEIYYLIYPIMSLCLMTWPLVIISILEIILLCAKKYQKYKAEDIVREV